MQWIVIATLLLVVTQMNKLCKWLTYITFAASCIPARYLSINLGVFQLSIYRVGLVLLTFLRLAGMRKGIQIGEYSFSRKYRVFFYVWVAYAVLSIIWVNDMNGYAKQVAYLSCAMLDVLIATSFLTTRKDIINVLKGFECMIILHSAIGWYEIITRNYLFKSAEVVSIYTNTKLVYYRIPLSMYGENEYAILMLFGLLIEFALMRIKASKVGRTISLIAMLNCLMLIFMGQTRSVWLALGIAVIVFLVTSKRGKFAIPLAILLIPLVFPSILDKASDVLKFDFAESVSDVFRLNMIKNGLNFFVDSYGFGIGAGQFEYFVQNYARVFYTNTNAHNFIIEMLANYGWLITLAYCILYSQLIIRVRRYYHATRDVISISLLCYLVSNVLLFVTSSSMMGSEFAWSVMAVIIAYSSIPLVKQSSVRAVV